MSSSGIHLNYRMVCPPCFQEEISSVAAPVHFIDSAEVSQWVRTFDAAFPRFESIAKNGLHSVLQKEIKDITPLLGEGQVIAGSTSHLSILLSMVDQLVKPRLAKLKTALADANKKFADESRLAGSDEGVAEKWKALGLPASVLEHHADCARFLIESKLIFTIAGFNTTCGNAKEDALKLDTDGHPMIKMEGRDVRWETLSRQLEFDPKAETIKSRGYSGSLVETWNYFHPEGLVKRDRFTYDAVYPIYDLPQEEYDRLLVHSKKFFETHPEKDPGIAKDCVLQFFTSPRRQGMPEGCLFENPALDYGFLFDNAAANYPIHIGMRLITADKKVYSFGFQLPPEERDFILSDPLSNFTATALGKVGMLDYEEFRPHEGRVTTSVPMSRQASENFLKFLNDIKDEQLRFQYMRQSCPALMQVAMQCAGYEVDVRTTATSFVWGLLPDLNQFPVIGGVVKQIEDFMRNFWEMLPGVISKPLEWTKDVVCYVPKKIGTVITNLFIWKLGAAKKSTALPEGVSEDELYDKKGFQNFSSLIRTWGDLFKDETSVIYHSKLFVDWQKAQKSTFIEPSSDLPRLAVVPPVV